MSDKQTDSKKVVLVTGAAGNIGAYFAEHTNTKYKLKLVVRKDDERAEKLRSFGDVIIGDLDDKEKLKEYFKGVHTVVHMAGDPTPSSTWDSLLQGNIVGTYNVMVAAKASGVKRVIYASSIHAISGSPLGVQAKTHEPVNPGDLYGVTKCFGEALGRYMAEHEGLSVHAIRIGAFQPDSEAEKKEEGSWMLDTFVSQRDLTQLLCCSIDKEDLQWAILHGLSDNTFKRMDLTDTCQLVGYKPQDNCFDLNPYTKDAHLSQRIKEHNTKDEGQKSGLRKDL